MTEDELESSHLKPAEWKADDLSEAKLKALQYRSWLAESLERDYDEMVLKATTYKALPTELLRAATAGVQAAKVILWSSELLQVACKNHSKYSEQIVEADDLPNNPELWLSFYGGSDETVRLESEQFFVGSRLVLPFPDQHFVAYLKILHPLSGHLVDRHAVPRLGLYGTLYAGELVARNKGGEMYSCLRYLNETVEAERNLTPPTKARRKVERARPTETGIRIHKLRKIVFQPGTDSERAPHCYAFRYPVRSFVRKPSPLMRDPHPVVVRAHVRGPADKPLRDPTPTVYVVTR